MPYQRVGVASNFSPRYRAVLAEACRLATLFDSQLAIVHADQESEEKRIQFLDTLKDLEWEETPDLLWAKAESPAASISQAAEEGALELLIAGAVERQVEHRNFLGSVARELIRQGPCDLFLITDPEEASYPIQRIVIDVDGLEKGDRRLKQIRLFAERCQAKEILFISIQTPFSAALGGGGREEREERIEAAAAEFEGFPGELDAHIIESNTGFSACDFVQTAKADVMVVGTSSTNGTRHIPHYMDWLTQVIPCNLWLIGPALGIS